MAEVINTNVFSSEKKFVDLSGLDYFWGKAKTYIDGVDATMSAKVVANENAIKEINDELDSLSGGAGSIGTQIDNKIAALDLPNTYDAKGSANAALTDAKAYADSLAGNYDAVGSADAVSEVLTEHKNDTTAHITADERTAWNDAKEAIDAFLKDADMTESAVDTLKELQTYMSNDGAAATELVNRVANLEKIDHEAYIAADETILANAKSYVDEKVDGKFDAVGSAATAKTEAIAQAKTDAAEALRNYYTRTEVDDLLSTNSTGDRAYAKQYTDELFNSFKFAANSDIDEMFAE